MIEKADTVVVGDSNPEDPEISRVLISQIMDQVLYLKHTNNLLVECFDVLIFVIFFNHCANLLLPQTFVTEFNTLRLEL